MGLLKYFLGIDVTYTSDGSLHLSQHKYIQDLLVKANMHKAKPINTPIVSSLKLTKEGADLMSNPSLYRSILGALQYATITRPKISFSVSKISQFMHTPLEEH